MCDVGKDDDDDNSDDDGDNNNDNLCPGALYHGPLPRPIYQGADPA